MKFKDTIELPDMDMLGLAENLIEQGVAVFHLTGVSPFIPHCKWYKLPEDIASHTDTWEDAGLHSMDTISPEDNFLLVYLYSVPHYITLTNSEPLITADSNFATGTFENLCVDKEQMQLNSQIWAVNEQAIKDFTLVVPELIKEFPIIKNHDGLALKLEYQDEFTNTPLKAIITIDWTKDMTTLSEIELHVHMDYLDTEVFSYLGFANDISFIAKHMEKSFNYYLVRLLKPSDKVQVDTVKEITQ